jgi:hypothetical protein
MSLMENDTNKSPWLFRNFFLIAIAVYIGIYIRWLQLTPPTHLGINDSSDAWKFGSKLIVVFVGFAIALRLLKIRSCLKILLFGATALLLVLNTWYLATYMPRVVDTATHNGTKYYLVFYRQFIDTQWSHYQLTEWYGFFQYDSKEVPHTEGKFMYDEKMKVMNIVARYKDFDQLVYTDSNPPREYDHTVAQFENHLIYLSVKCDLSNKGLYSDMLTYTSCNSFTNMLYKCEQDNTACVQIPFKYTSENDGYAYLELNQETGEIDLFIEPHFTDDPSNLIYSYGDHPRCYVEGCEILTSP